MIRNNRVLVCHRNKEIREILSDAMVTLGIQCSSAADGREAVERMADDPRPGLVITGMQLDHVSGAELVKIAREQDLDTPFIIFTNSVPPCFVPGSGVSVFDSLEGLAPLLKHVIRLAA